MKIMIAGLGLIGGSMAKALRRAGIAADGTDREEVCARALAEGAVGGVARDLSAYDVVLIALPPAAAMRMLDEGGFADGAIVADICGIKDEIEKLVFSKPRNYRYVGCHPMAGKEVSGFENSCETLFDGASMIVIENEKTDKAARETLEALFLKMGFGCIRRCDARYHDRKIAYTSQLAHIVSNAYVKSETANGFPGFTGGSFQDMTRIAGVDESVWTDLYFLNRDAVTEELSGLIARLEEYLAALKNGDREGLRALLRAGRLRKAELDAERKIE